MFNSTKRPYKRSMSLFYKRVAEILRHTGQFFAGLLKDKKSQNIRYQRPITRKRVVCAVNVCLAAVALVVSLGWFSYAMLAKSSVFQVADITVRGNKMASEFNVLEKAGLRNGGSLIDLDVEKAKNNISSLPWVDEVTVKRRWPSTVEIIVREHKPLAIVNLEDKGSSQLYYVDTKGEVFAPVHGAADLDFPVISGCSLKDDLKEMSIRPDSMVDNALYILKLAARGNQILPLQGISEVQACPDKGLIVYLVDYPFPIYMGQEEVRDRYYLLVRVLTQLYKKDRVKDIKEIRMNYAEGKIMVASKGKS